MNTHATYDPHTYAPQHSDILFTTNQIFINQKYSNGSEPIVDKPNSVQKKKKFLF